jgi:hypothetical protein
MQKFVEVFLLNKKQGSSHWENICMILHFQIFTRSKMKFYIHTVQIL